MSSLSSPDFHVPSPPPTDQAWATLPDEIAADLLCARRMFLQRLVEVGESSRAVGRTVSMGRRVLAPIREMVGHLGKMQGKQLRAVLALVSGRACRADQEKAVSLAVIVEMIHLATLIHDDIIDDGRTRRGLPSLPSVSGPTVSVLMGDLLYAKAMSLLARFSESEVIRWVVDHVEQVCVGEISQHRFSMEEPPTEEEYVQVVGNKTGMLMAAASGSGAVLSGLGASVVRSLAEYGFHLGIAFQIRDDLLDLSGSADKLGKEVGVDARNGLPTLPLVRAAETLGAGYGEWLRNVGKDRVRLLQGLEEMGALHYAAEKGLERSEKAKESLGGLAAARGTDLDRLAPLFRIAESAVTRDH